MGTVAFVVYYVAAALVIAYHLASAWRCRRAWRQLQLLVWIQPQMSTRPPTTAETYSRRANWVSSPDSPKEEYMKGNTQAR